MSGPIGRAGRRTVPAAHRDGGSVAGARREGLRGEVGPPWLVSGVVGARRVGWTCGVGRTRAAGHHQDHGTYCGQGKGRGS